MIVLRKWLLRFNNRMKHFGIVVQSAKRKRTSLERARAGHTRDASNRNGSDRLSPLRQQCQSLSVIHGLPRDKFVGKHIHSAKES
jgi:hypothetical protein